MKLLFVTLFLLGGLKAFGQSLNVFEAGDCQFQQVDLADKVSHGYTVGIPSCDTEEHYNEIKKALADYPAFLKLQLQKKQPAQQVEAAQPSQYDLNKSDCSIGTLGSTTSSSWEKCLTDANTMYCYKKDQLEKGKYPLVTFTKGGKITQKQFTKDDVSCTGEAAKNDATAKKYPCIYKGGSYPGIETGHEFGSFSSNEDCLKAIKENFRLKPTSMCYDNGAHIDTYNLHVLFQLSNTSISDKTLSFDCNANNWGAKPSHSSLDNTTTAAPPAGSGR